MPPLLHRAAILMMMMMMKSATCTVTMIIVCLFTITIQPNIVMAALYVIGGHYIFAL